MAIEMTFPQHMSQDADLVNEVDLGLGSQVAQQVHGAVQVEHCGDLATHAVVQAPGPIGVDEAVANPQAWVSTTLHRVQFMHR